MILTNNFVHWIIIIEFNKSETAFFLIIFVHDDVDRGHIAKFSKVITQIFFVVLILQTANEQFLHRCAGLWPIDVLTWHGTFWLDHAAIDLVWACILRFVHHK